MSVLPSCFDYVAYDDSSKLDQSTAKDMVMKLEALIRSAPFEFPLPPGRTLDARLAALTEDQQAFYNALHRRWREYGRDALKDLERCYMNIGKLIRDGQIARNGSAPLEEGRTNG